MARLDFKGLEAKMEQKLREEMVQVVNELYATGLITATGGNVSARLPESEQVIITPSQLFKGDLRPEILVRIHLDGRRLDDDAPKPSMEWPMHCAIYTARPDVRAIIHPHAPQATVLGLTGLPFLPISTEAAFLGELPRVPYFIPGTHERAQAVVGAVGDGAAVLMQNHGVLVVGSILRRAADVAEVIERTAEMILGCYAVGREPPTLPAEMLPALRQMGKMMA
jgi:autoinducer 2 (AI-2) kinase